jgi:hypothetical protein
VGDGAVELLLLAPGGGEGGLGILLKDRKLRGRERGDLPDGYRDDVLEPCVINPMIRHHAASGMRSWRMVWDGSSGFGRATAR